MNDVTFAKALSSVMLDNKYDRFVKNRRTGKLDTRGLYKINTSSRLFKRREARKNKDYAISLVVDCSGSMRGEKARMAADAAKRLSKHLSKMDIPHNIVTFAIHAREEKKFDPTHDPEIDQKILGILSIGKYATSSKNLAVWDIKTRSVENLGGSSEKMYPFVGMMNLEEYSVKRKFQALSAESTCGYNSDAEALKYARERILKQKGRKILIYLSDGQPAPYHANHFESPITKGYHQGQFNLKKEVERTIVSGVELYSIGIMDDSVNSYYPPRRTCVINKIDQLYPHIIKLIRVNLKRG